jgi:uncharacterized protein with ParB-like and HNH nuclease domain
MKTLDIKPVKIQTILSDNFFSIPAFQRDYVWKDSNVEDFFNDIFDSYIENKGEYYLGNIVLAKGDDSSQWAIVDGQQRMTTTSIFVKALINFIAEKIDQNVLSNYVQILDKMIRDFDTNIGKHRNRISFLYAENSEYMEDFYKAKHAEVLNKDKLTGTQTNLYAAYETLFALLEKHFLDKDNTEKLQSFLSYFLNKVVFSVVFTEDLKHALYIFQTLNDRGVGLAPTDLLKNLLLMRAGDDKDKIVAKWKEFVASIEKGNKLNQNIKIDRFLRHYIMAKYGKHDLKVTDVFKYLESNQDELNITSKPLDFLKEIKSKAEQYVANYEGVHLSSGESVESLVNMRELRFMSQLLLLMFADKFPKDSFMDFCKRVENLLFAYTVTGKLTKDFESLFCKWTTKIAQIDTVQEYENFIKNDFDVEFNSQKNNFKSRFLELSQEGQTKYRQRYILSKLEQYLERAITHSDSKSRKTIEEDNKEIEHILPQSPSADLKVRFESTIEDGESYDGFVQKLGNLTLLPKAINIVSGNKFFEEKTKEYLAPSQGFILTKSICENIEIGEDTLLNKIIRHSGIKPFTEWDRKSILQRQEQLTNLAMLVWGFETL